MTSQNIPCHPTNGPPPQGLPQATHSKGNRQNLLGSELRKASKVRGVRGMIALGGQRFLCPGKATQEPEHS